MAEKYDLDAAAMDMVLHRAGLHARADLSCRCIECASARAIVNMAEEIKALLEQTQWRPIETAPKTFMPKLSPINHHSPNILGLWGKSFYSICSWGGDSNPFWIDGDNKKIAFQPELWLPLLAPPAAEGGKK